jgi:3-phenylpropionate/trans-cinnamate dioxygenase ferredoxin subunit
MRYIVAAKVADVLPGQMKPFLAEGKKILIANVGGKFFAMQQNCPHMGGNLCKGQLVGRVVTCPTHSARFDVESGKALEGPKLLFWRLRTKNAVTYPVTIEGDSVLIGL